MTHDPIRDDLDQVIREIGIREVGRRAGVTGATVQKWLAGATDLRLQTLYAIMQACDRELRVIRTRRVPKA